MSHDPLVTPSFRSDRARRFKQAEETLGVFSDGAGWKVYSPSDAAAAYATRQEALSAAEARACAAARAGRRVALFVQHEDGSLAQAPLDMTLDLH